MLNELERDDRSGLALVVDDSNPPRYFLVSRCSSHDLLSVGDLALAKGRFAGSVAMAPETFQKPVTARDASQTITTIFGRSSWSLHYSPKT